MTLGFLLYSALLIAIGYVIRVAMEQLNAKEEETRTN
jgi:hypothetical protein